MMSPLTVPLSTTWGASTEPSMTPCSLTETEAVPGATRTLPVDLPIDVQAAGEFHIALYTCGATDQGIDGAWMLVAAVEHQAPLCGVRIPNKGLAVRRGALLCRSEFLW